MKIPNTETTKYFEGQFKDYSEGFTLLGTVLSVIQIGLLRGQFAGMHDIEGFTKAMDSFTHQHSRILNSVRSRVNADIEATASLQQPSQECSAHH